MKNLSIRHESQFLPVMRNPMDEELVPEYVTTRWKKKIEDKDIVEYPAKNYDRVPLEDKRMVERIKGLSSRAIAVETPSKQDQFDALFKKTPQEEKDDVKGLPIVLNNTMLAWFNVFQQDYQLNAEFVEKKSELKYPRTWPDKFLKVVLNSLLHNLGKPSEIDINDLIDLETNRVIIDKELKKRGLRITTSLHRLSIREANILTTTTKDCPFGLEILKACTTAGDSVKSMSPDNKERNVKIYKIRQTGHKCPFAAQLNVEKKFVNCSFGDSAAGMGNLEMTQGSPIYPRLWEGFNTINLDRSYHAYKDFSYFSIYGSLRRCCLSKRSGVQ